MKIILNVDSINDYNEVVDQETFHPLVSVIDFSKTKAKENTTVGSLNFGFYAVFLKEDKNCSIRYGRNYYDYKEGTLIFIAPGQIVSIEEDGENYQPSGRALLFHPDLIRGTSLGKKIKDYTFFSYDVHEALHLSLQERQFVKDCFEKIDMELKRAIDNHSKNLIVSNIELFLNYCIRFYDRQFITRDNAHRGILEKLENLLNNYFQSDILKEGGPPTVAFCAGELNLSPNYFGDLVKKQTGRTAQEYIHNKLMEVAIEKVFDTTKSLSEISYELGFKYPQHFSRFFKQHEGVSPNEYRLTHHQQRKT